MEGRSPNSIFSLKDYRLGWCSIDLAKVLSPKLTEAPDHSTGVRDIDKTEEAALDEALELLRKYIQRAPNFDLMAGGETL